MGAKLDRSPGKPVTAVVGSTIPGHAFNQDGKHFDCAGNEIVEVAEEDPTFGTRGVIDFVDKNLDGYINKAEIKEKLDKTDAVYHDKMSRDELMELLKGATLLEDFDDQINCAGNETVKAVKDEEQAETATKDVEYVCPECSTSFPKERALTMHRTRMHPSG